MTEFLSCNACTAIVSTEMNICEYCGNNFRNSGTSAEILKFSDALDRKCFSINVDDFLKLIDTSKFKEHPIVQFRKAKVLLIECITNNGVLEASEFCEFLHIINKLKKISPDYLTEFTLYISVLLPTQRSKLFLEDYNVIKSFLADNNFDEEGIIDKKLKQQMVITDLGVQFFEEYNFYTDAKNSIRNQAFINKKNMLISKYNKFFLTNKLK